MRRLSLALIAVAIAVAQVQAHDFWLAPASWEPTVGGTLVTITGNVGDKFPVVDDGASPSGVETWRVIGPNGALPVTAAGFRRQGLSIATGVTMAAPGTYLGLMTVRARVIAMDGQDFTNYLREEGIESVIAERARLGETNTPVRERYARYAKVVIRNGEGDGSHVTRPAGLKAEFVPTTDPSAIGSGESLTVQFMVEGKPVSGAPVIAVSAKARLDVRTDADGRATFVIPHAGPWLIKTVHMIRPAKPGSPRVHWESHWVTLTFNAS